MTWRVHLPHPVIRRIDLLVAEKTVVAVWTQPDRVHFYDQRNGSLLGERVVEKLAFSDRQDERWRAFLNGLKAPNERFLPVVRAQNMLIRTTEDGRTRLLDTGDGLYLEVLGKESLLTIEQDSKLIAVELDRESGAVVGLDMRGRLHVFQQRLYAGIYDTGLESADSSAMRVLVADGGNQIMVTDGQSVVMMDALGKVRKRLELHYSLGAWGVSQDGKWLATGDAETGVMRLYDGTTLMPAYQRFAIDLAADARRLNPSAGNQPSSVVPGVLALTNRGVLAFAMGSLLCVTSMTKMRAVPASQA